MFIDQILTEFRRIGNASGTLTILQPGPLPSSSPDDQLIPL